LFVKRINILDEVDDLIGKIKTGDADQRKKIE
jgi:hypothetical protein